MAIKTTFVCDICGTNFTQDHIPLKLEEGINIGCDDDHVDYYELLVKQKPMSCADDKRKCTNRY